MKLKGLKLMTQIQYTKQDDYLLSNLLPPQDRDNRSIGKYGRMRCRYLKEHCRILYTNLLTSGKLYERLAETEAIAQNRMELLTLQMVKAQGVTEQLKASNQMEWVGRMNNIHHAAEEVILKELIYQ